VRWSMLAPLGVVGAHVSRVSLLGVVVPVAIVVVLRRPTQPLAYLRAAVWVAGVVALRVVAAGAVAASFGVARPFAAALLVVPAVELAGVVSLAPANLGIAGGAAALAFRLHGTPSATAAAAGFALHGVETATALAVGTASAVTLARRRAAGTDGSGQRGGDVSVSGR
jgi:hypothetical protein